MVAGRRPERRTDGGEDKREGGREDGKLGVCPSTSLTADVSHVSVTSNASTETPRVG